MTKESAKKNPQLIGFSNYCTETEQNNNAIGKRLSELRASHGMTITELTRQLCIFGIKLDRSTIGKWESGISTPNAYQLIAICKLFHVSSIDFFTLNTSANVLNEEGIKKLESYKTDLIASGRYRPKQISIITGICYRKMPVSTLPVSAGAGAWLDSEAFEYVDVPENTIPQGAEFGLRISGDSMEPVYRNNQIVWVQLCETLLPGEVGIMIYDGEGYIKVYSEQDPENPDDFIDSQGVLHRQPVMISYNPRYEPRKISPNLKFSICGRVLN